MRRLAVAALVVWQALAAAGPAFAGDDGWCATQCAALFGPKPKEPSCQRYELVYSIENGRSVEKKRFIQSCMEQYYAWSDRVDRRQAAVDTLETPEACRDWCRRVMALRKDAPFALPADRMEIWEILRDADVCALDRAALEDLALVDVSASCAGMVLVPEGDFQMGCNPAQAHADKWCLYLEEELGLPCPRQAGKCDPSETPSRTVTLSPYFIDRSEVTVAAFTPCVQAGACSEPPTNASLRFYNYAGLSRDLHPVNGVTWEQAFDFCSWQGKRLCTEAEWEKAARGPDGRTYPWGDTPPNETLAVMDSTTDRTDESLPWPLVSTTAQVCSREAGNSPYGLCDMAGNVWEWVADWYSPTAYASQPSADPRGPNTGTLKAIKGGRYNHVGFSVRSSIRGFFPPDQRFVYLGFRCCADAAFAPLPPHPRVPPSRDLIRP